MSSSRTKFMALCGVCAGLTMICGDAAAIDFHWRGVDVVWTGETRYDTHGNPYFVAAWVESGYPGSAGDNAIFQAGGTCWLNVSPTINSISLDHPGAVLISSARTITLGQSLQVLQGRMDVANSTVSAGSGVSNAATLNSYGGTSLPSTVNTGTLLVGGSGTYGHAMLTVTSLYNQGLLKLQTLDGGYDSGVTGTVENLPGSTIRLNTGAGGNRTVSGTVNNQGSILTEAVNSYFGGTINNTGSISIGGFAQLAGTGNTLNQNSGSISVPGGPFMLYGTNLNVLAGSMSDGVYLFNGALTFKPGSTITGILHARGVSSATGRINPGFTVKTEGDGTGGHASLNVSSCTNAGTILLETSSGGYDSNLSGPLLNDTPGLLAMTAGGGGRRFISSGLLENRGTITTNGVETQFRGSLLNTGSIQVQAGSTFRLYDASSLTMNGGSLSSDTQFWAYGGSYILNLGTLSGNVGITNGAVTIAKPVQGVVRTFGATTLTGTVGPSAEVRGEGCGEGGHATLAMTNVRNEGKITLETLNGGYDSSATGDLTNAAGATLSTKAGAGGIRYYQGTIANQGSIRVESATTQFRGVLNNGASIAMIGTGTLSLYDAATLNQNAGTISADPDSYLWMYGGTMNLNAGTLAGRVGIHNGTVNLNQVVTGSLKHGGRLT